MRGDGSHGIILQKGSTVVRFHIKIKTPGGDIWHWYFKCGCEVTKVLGDAQHKLSVDQAHCLLGHPDKSCMQRIAKFLGWHLKVGVMTLCMACLVMKAQQANVNKVFTSDFKSSKAGEHFF